MWLRSHPGRSIRPVQSDLPGARLPAKDISALILRKNLFGLEIDDRAAQLAAFALMMKARADDRRIFDSEAKPSILAFEDSSGLDATNLTNALNSPISKDDVPRKYLFEEIEESETPLL